MTSQWPRAALFAALLLSTQSAGAASYYAIGNSLTNDLYPDGLVQIIADTGGAVQADYHIRGSASMTYIVANPQDITLARPDGFDVALAASAYDFVSLEPYNGLGTPTFGSEIDAIASVIELSLAAHPQAATVFYLYAAWPNQTDTAGQFASYWAQTGTFDAASTPLQTRACFDQMLATLRQRFGSRAVLRVIPIGDVFARIDQRIRAGDFATITDLSAFYRDTIHMGEAGRFVAAATVAATLLGRRPTAGTSLDLYQFNDGAVELTPELAAQLEDLVWSVVSGDPRTGVGKAASGESSGGGAFDVLALTGIAGAALLTCARRRRS